MRNMDKVRMVEFPQHGDERGHLVIVEGNQDIPFEIKRAFYIYMDLKKVLSEAAMPTESQNSY